VAVAELHRRASRWYEGNGLLREAIDHALTARDWEAALRLLAGASDRQMLTGEMVTLLGWFRAVPEDLLLARPPLCRSYSYALMFTGKLDRAEDVLGRAEVHVGDDAVERARIIASRAIVASLRGNIERSMELAREALPSLPAGDLGLRASLSMNLGVVHWYEGRLERAESLYSEAYWAGKQAGQPWTTTGALSMLADISEWRGDLSRAVELYEEAIASAPGSPTAAIAHGGLVDSLYERNELESAMSHLQGALELNRLLGHRQTQWGLLSNLARIRLALGDKAGALEATKQVDELIGDDIRPEARTHRAAHHLMLALHLGDLDEAARWGEQLIRDRVRSASGIVCSSYEPLPSRVGRKRSRNGSGASTIAPRSSRCLLNGGAG
jgi:LuxR family maltose regulon positive regulatory protein